MNNPPAKFNSDPLKQGKNLKLWEKNIKRQAESNTEATKELAARLAATRIKIDIFKYQIKELRKSRKIGGESQAKQKLHTIKLMMNLMLILTWKKPGLMN